MSLLSSLSRLNLHPMHWGHILSAFFAMMLLSENGCYNLHSFKYDSMFSNTALNVGDLQMWDGNETWWTTPTSTTTDRYILALTGCPFSQFL